MKFYCSKYYYLPLHEKARQIKIIQLYQIYSKLTYLFAPKASHKLFLIRCVISRRIYISGRCDIESRTRSWLYWLFVVIVVILVRPIISFHDYGFRSFFHENRKINKNAFIILA